MFNTKKKTKKRKESVKETVALSKPGAFELVISMLSDVGCVRELNEDSGRYVQPADPDVLQRKGVLIVVADGMGGHTAGEVASGLAVEVVSRAYYDDSGDPRSALETAFHKANLAIHNEAEKDASKNGMGTTCTALVLQNGTAISAHVGDSRLYLIRDGSIYLMTEDHSAVMEMVKAGLITLEQARHHPEKNVILRAMGSHPEVDVTTWQEPFPVRAGDRFLLCSDGLYDLVQDDEIKRIVSLSVPQTACENLISLAKERGGHDNITVGIVNLKPQGGDESSDVPETRTAETPK
ncbi:MAG TPA: Stp1/IreP family PP2C-type Ser/Thr phosphatase [Pyrinomonadaceae bacterium]|nr:Stp1/IreP family PP2C-type Ser/Thr phosphatase [Pyrinomonadaceae bacterium]